MRPVATLVVFCFTASTFTCQSTPGSTDYAGVTHADRSSYGGSLFSWRYSAPNQINTTNVKKLSPAWIFQTGDYAENLQATPIVENGKMYIITPRAQVFALDAATGHEIRHYQYPIPRPGRPESQAAFVQNRGVAVGGGRVIFGTNDSSVVALDEEAITGSQLCRKGLLWSVFPVGKIGRERAGFTPPRTELRRPA